MESISCVVTTHNRPESVCSAVESVFNQTTEPSEVIVICDNPTQDTVSSVRDLSDQYANLDFYIVEKGSPMGARNEGIKRATSQYLAFLDDDDRWLPNKLQHQLTYADEFSLVSCPAILVRQSSETPQQTGTSEILTMDYEDVFRSIRFLYPSGILLKTSQVKLIGGFNEDVPEWDFFLRITEKFGEACVVSEPLVKFNRQNLDRMSNNEEDFMGLFDVYDRYKHTVGKEDKAYRLSSLCLNASLKTNGPTSLFYLFRSILAHPSTAVSSIKRYISRLL
ncbi:glycosyltransferase involved in cell wall biosynthesis [Salinibacter ruber]|uniref:glycosyltransferase family A protein n=1 Tax=Salinibacter ruber TaxID=146919 RepID=UPI00216A24F1|nr:glycosyltransferase family A protein [Salinibacter ruber]MCS3935197.1 glycosyltransferase involved in cell wall biosynthesis [Salinibacter ruber]MCS4043232.1 glycosyltransferase involved in cell wall biosynthesis [Salinibacter ruber]